MHCHHVGIAWGVWALVSAIHSAPVASSRPPLSSAVPVFLTGRDLSVFMQEGSRALSSFRAMGRGLSKADCDRASLSVFARLPQGQGGRGLSRVVDSRLANGFGAAFPLLVYYVSSTRTIS